LDILIGTNTVEGRGLKGPCHKKVHKFLAHHAEVLWILEKFSDSHWSQEGQIVQGGDLIDDFGKKLDNLIIQEDSFNSTFTVNNN